jgi:hypothetical protein
VEAAASEAFKGEALPGEGPAAESAKLGGEVMLQGLALEVAARLVDRGFALRLRHQGKQLRG